MNNTTSDRQTLYGLTADVHFWDLLSQPQLLGTIEQVFNKAINILIKDKLYTLLSSQLDNAPNSCRLLNKDFSVLKMSCGDDIYITNGTIHIGKHYLLSFSLCKLWHKPIIFFPYDRIGKESYQLFLFRQMKSLDSILATVKNSLFSYQGNNAFYLAASEKLNQLRSDLLHLLKNRQHQNLGNVVRQFIGLGIGLTPSGDDYLVGLMAFLLLRNHPAEVVHSDFYQGVMQGNEQTTPISAITLEKALHHEYRENMYQLMQSLVDANEIDIHSQFLNILNIGSSSGSDMLFGMRDALYLTHYFGERYVD